MRYFLLGIIALGATTAPACMWDDDTLSAEARGLPHVVDAIVGRIDVNPPEYYTLRLELSQKDIVRDPSDWQAYDNIAVALDKLGRGREGLDWLDKKRVAMNDAALRPTKDPMNDPWYRYHANRGTLLIHLWFAKGRPDDRALIDKGLAELRQALDINPDAHFGRERVQIKVVEILSARDPDGPHSRAEDDWAAFVKEHGSEKARVGLLGIMALGAGWNSPDLIALLASTTDRHDGHLRELAMFRIKDLDSTGHKPILSVAHLTRILTGYAPSNIELLEKQYRSLVSSGNDYRKNRNEFMLAKVNVGLHPDNDPGFWDGYKETPRPDIARMEPLVPVSGLVSYGSLAVAAVAGLAVVAALVLFVRGRLVTR